MVGRGVKAGLLSGAISTPSRRQMEERCAVMDGNRISLKALLPSIVGFGITAGQSDPAVKDLGFSQSQVAKGPLVGDSLNTFALQGGEVFFDFFFRGAEFDGLHRGGNAGKAGERDEIL